MTDTNELIATLSAQASPVRPLKPPVALALRLGAVLFVYGLLVAMVLHLRPDLLLQLQRPLYLTELVLLLGVVFTSLAASVHLVFPDQYQHPTVARLPVLTGIAFLALLVAEALLPPDVHAVIPEGVAVKGAECALCIAAVAILPSCLMMILLRRGASVQPLLSGVYAVLAAAATGCFVLRLIEANDAIAHLALGHYLPTLGFAAIGGMAGKFILRW